mmetsp:Transcript_8603/g.12461  ORF Transcript_8603/g.12461 Transcript_8603/m.12461 type:complete len:82 (-) Transcript_8603:74-319(-)
MLMTCQVVVHFAMNAWALELQNAVSAWETSMSSFQNGDKNLFVQFVIKVDTRYAENVVGVAGLPNGLNWLNFNPETSCLGW